MNINYELYKTFDIVANCSTITEAAKKLKISQPAVTKAIKNLEWQLDCTLFIRNKQGIKLTENRIRILRLILANPNITKTEMADNIGISENAVSKNIEAMRGKLINRVGPDKGGLWEVLGK